MTPKKPETKTKIIDIAKPGSLAPASASSRPIIVSNRTTVQDPMMVSASATKAPAEPVLPMAKIVIKPLGDETAEAASPAPSEPAVAAAPAETAPVDTPAGPKEPAVDDDTAATDKTALDKQNAELEADAKAQDELDSLVEEKKFFLPINASVQRRSRHVFIFGTILIVVLALAWLNIALDAGFVTIPGVEPVTHLFGN